VSSQTQSTGSGREIARSARSVSVAVFCSRILGLVREQVLAYLFGAGTAMDAFVVAFRVPNLLRDLFAEGALSSAFVAVFADYDKNRSQEETRALVRNVLTVLAAVVSLVVLVGMAFSREFVAILAPDFQEVPGKIQLASQLASVMFPFLLLVSVSALLMGVLNTRGHFFLPAISSSFFNLGSILVGGGLALLMPLMGRPPILGMAIGTLAGGLFQMGVQLPLFLRNGFSMRPLVRLQDPGLRRVAKLVLPAIIGLSATQLTIFINTNFASRCAEGSVAWLSYAFRLMQFPIGLFGVALSVASLPVLSRLAASRDFNAFGDTLVSSLALASALTIPASVGLWILAEPITALIFEHGRFTRFDTLMTAEAIRFYSVGLSAYAGAKILIPAFYSLNDTRWPVIGSFLSVALNVGIILLALHALEHRAIALSTSVSMLANLILLAFVLYRKTGGYPVGRLARTLARILAASAIMAAALCAASRLIPDPSGFASRLAYVLGTVTLGVASYALSAYLLGVREIRGILVRGTEKF